jgi:hypothetical protein
VPDSNRFVYQGCSASSMRHACNVRSGSLPADAIHCLLATSGCSIRIMRDDSTKKLPTADLLNPFLCSRAAALELHLARLHICISNKDLSIHASARHWQSQRFAHHHLPSMVSAGVSEPKWFCGTSLEAYRRPTEPPTSNQDSALTLPDFTSQTRSICAAVLTGDAQQLKVTHLSHLDANSINQLQQVCFLAAAAVHVMAAVRWPSSQHLSCYILIFFPFLKTWKSVEIGVCTVL